MRELLKIAVRNLARYKRRTLLTASLITIGVVFVLGYIAVAGSFKNMMIAQITDSYLGDAQVHRKGYIAAVDTLPLNLNLKQKPYSVLEDKLKTLPEVESYSPRIRFAGMFSTFADTTTIRMNGVDPHREFQTVPLLTARVKAGEAHLNRGEIFVPELLANGMGVKPGGAVVIVATNRDGSVNGMQFRVSGILQSAQGPGGRDGYINIEDAAQLLRMQELEISEVAIRLKDFNQYSTFTQKLDRLLGQELNPKGKPVYEVHSWETLTPFGTVAHMIDLMTFSIKVMLIAVVLVSILNVMIMAVYERVREIGTIAAIGTSPRKILSMFLLEGLSLGAFSVVLGDLVGVGIIVLLHVVGIRFDFGMMKAIFLRPTIGSQDVLMVSGIVILIAVLASLQPAFKASRMEPIQALRHV